MNFGNFTADPEKKMAIPTQKELTKRFSEIPPAPPRVRKRQALYITIRPH